MAQCAALALLFLMAGCGGSLYKVKPVLDAPLAGVGHEVEVGGLTLRAAPLLTDEESQELFEANLQLAGLLPVRVEMLNTSGAEVVLKRLKFQLRDESGAVWKVRTAKQAVSRILKSNDISLYNPNSKAKFEEAVSAHAFKTDIPLGPSERRQGLLFFEAPRKEPVSNPRGLTLTIEGLPQAASLRLN